MKPVKNILICNYNKPVYNAVYNGHHYNYCPVQTGVLYRQV